MLSLLVMLVYSITILMYSLVDLARLAPSSVGAGLVLPLFAAKSLSKSSIFA